MCKFTCSQILVVCCCYAVQHFAAELQMNDVQWSLISVLAGICVRAVVLLAQSFFCLSFAFVTQSASFWCSTHNGG